MTKSRSRSRTDQTGASVSMSRRQVMIGAAGLTFAFGVDVPAAISATVSRTGTGKPFSPWVSIAEDGTISVMAPAVEMGQGSLTSLPRILAEELDADWNKVRIVPAPAQQDKIYGNPATPATSVVFGEQGAGKTALRLQIIDKTAEYNSQNPGNRAFVLQYDDFNPFLDRFRDRFGARRRRADRVLSDFGLWDHMDAILVLGTTLATNAVLEGKWAATGVITTAGFRDVLELARQRRPHYFNLDIPKPMPPAARDCRLEVTERVAQDGAVVTPLVEDDVRRAVEVLKVPCGVVQRKVTGSPSGSVAVAEKVLNDEQKADGWCLSCRAVPVTDVTISLREENLRLNLRLQTLDAAQAENQRLRALLDSLTRTPQPLRALIASMEERDRLPQIELAALHRRGELAVGEIADSGLGHRRPLVADAGRLIGSGEECVLDELCEVY